MPLKISIEEYNRMLPAHLQKKTSSRKGKKIQKTVWYRDGKTYTFSRPEDVVHFEAARHLKLNYPEIIFQSNHMAGKSLKLTGKKFNPILKNVAALNGTKGMPDLIVFHRTQFIGLVLELKQPGGSLTKEEKEVLAKLETQGYKILVVGNKSETIQKAAEEVVSLIDSYFNGGFDAKHN